MSKIIKITDVKNKKLTFKKQHHDALTALADVLHHAEATSHEKIICEFIYSLKEKKQSLALLIRVIIMAPKLNETVSFVLKTLSSKSQERIMDTIRTTWPRNNDAVLRLVHISQLANFWEKQSPDIPFSQIIPTEVLFEFLRSCENN